MDLVHPATIAAVPISIHASTSGTPLEEQGQTPQSATARNTSQALRKNVQCVPSSIHDDGLNSHSSVIGNEHRDRSGNDGKVHVRRMYIMNPKT